MGGDDQDSRMVFVIQEHLFMDSVCFLGAERFVGLLCTDYKLWDWIVRWGF